MSDRFDLDYVQALLARIAELERERARFQEWPCGHANIVEPLSWSGCPICAMIQGTSERIAELDERASRYLRESEAHAEVAAKRKEQLRRAHERIAELERDKARLDRLEQAEASLVPHRERWDGCWTIWWSVVRRGRAMAHPNTSVRAAIDAMPEGRDA